MSDPKTVTERVAALQLQKPIKITEVHIICDSECQSYFGGWEICQNWSPAQLEEWIWVKVQGFGEDDASLDDDDTTITGWGYDPELKEFRNTIVLEGHGDRDHFFLAILVRG